MVLGQNNVLLDRLCGELHELRVDLVHAYDHHRTLLRHLQATQSKISDDTVAHLPHHSIHLVNFNQLQSALHISHRVLCGPLLRQ